MNCATFCWGVTGVFNQICVACTGDTADGLDGEDELALARSPIQLEKEAQADRCTRPIPVLWRPELWLTVQPVN